MCPHLLGTARILETWGTSSDVVTAGLFHSVYGTEVFTTTMIPEGLRPEVERYIGSRAEHLTYLFGALNRKKFLESVSQGQWKIISRFDGSILSESREDFESICNIYVANRLEQHPRWDDEWRYG